MEDQATAKERKWWGYIIGMVSGGVLSGDCRFPGDFGGKVYHENRFCNRQVADGDGR